MDNEIAFLQVPLDFCRWNTTPAAKLIAAHVRELHQRGRPYLFSNKAVGELFHVGSVNTVTSAIKELERRGIVSITTHTGNRRELIYQERDCGEWFAAIPRVLLAGGTDLTPLELLIAGLIHAFNRQGNACTLSQAEIAQALAVSPRIVFNALKALSEKKAARKNLLKIYKRRSPDGFIYHARWLSIDALTGAESAKEVTKLDTS